MVELLTGALVGGAMRDKDAARNWSALVVAMRPMVQQEGAFEAVRQLCQRVKAARREPGVEEVLLPGERGYRLAGASIESPPLCS